MLAARAAANNAADSFFEQTMQGGQQELRSKVRTTTIHRDIYFKCATCGCCACCAVCMYVCIYLCVYEYVCMCVICVRACFSICACMCARNVLSAMCAKGEHIHKRVFC